MVGSVSGECGISRGHGAGGLVSPSEAALKGCHECTLPQVGTQLDVALDVARK